LVFVRLYHVRVLSRGFLNKNLENVRYMENY